MMTFPIYGKIIQMFQATNQGKKVMKSSEKKKVKSDESDEVLSLYLYDDIYIYNYVVWLIHCYIIVKSLLNQGKS